MLSVTLHELTLFRLVPISSADLIDSLYTFGDHDVQSDLDISIHNGFLRDGTENNQSSVVR